MTVVPASAGVLAASATAALGVVLYLGVAFLVLRLSLRWAREALGEVPAGDPTAPKAPARG